MITKPDLVTLIEQHAALVDQHPLDMLNIRCDSSDPWKVGCAVILSANTTDAAVNKCLPDFLLRYPLPRDILASTDDEIIPYLPAINHSGVKARYLRNWATFLIAHPHGMPATLEALMSVTGIGYKSATIIIFAVHGLSVGMPLDTHALRIIERTGWVPSSNNPQGVAKRLLQTIPLEKGYPLFEILTMHGRKICHPTQPLCHQCKWATTCNYANKQRGTL